jgi:hypothetical protein
LKVKSNVEVYNLQFQSTASGSGDGGHSEYRNCIQLKSASNSAIHDILFTPYLYNDCVRIIGSTDINVYNCKISAGHDGIQFLSGSSNCRAYNNDIDIRVNTGIRVDNGNGMRLDHNTFYGLHGSGWCCTEMEDIVQVEIDHNIFHDYQGSSGNAAVQPVHASGSVSVHDNVLWNVGEISMGSGPGNIINPSDRNAENWMAKGYGYGSVDITPNTKTDSTNITDLTNKTESTNKTDPINMTDSTNITVSMGAIAQQSMDATNSASTSARKVPATVKFTDKSKEAKKSGKISIGNKKTLKVKKAEHKITKLGKSKVNRQ